MRAVTGCMLLANVIAVHPLPEMAQALQQRVANAWPLASGCEEGYEQ